MLEIRDAKLLAALQKALYEAKFDRPPDDVSEIAGSPYVAEVYRMVVAACISAAREAGKLREVARIEEWLRAESHVDELEMVRHHIAATKPWPKMSAGAKEAYVRDLASPFVLSAETLQSLLREGDLRHGVAEPR